MKKILLIGLLCVSTIMFAVSAAGCTEKGLQEVVSGINADSEPSVKDDSDVQEVSAQNSLLDASKGTPVIMRYEGIRQGNITDFSAESTETAKTAVNAIKKIKVIKEVPDPESDESDDITIIYDSNGQDRLIFQGGRLVIDDKFYEVSGYDELITVINEANSQDEQGEQDDSDEQTSSGVTYAASVHTMPSLWDDDKGELVEVAFRYDEETVSDYFETDDKTMLAELEKAIDGIKLTAESSERTRGNGVILLYNAKNKNGRIEYENKKEDIRGKAYETEGYAELSKVLKKIEENYPEWQKKYDDFVLGMSKVDNRVSEMCTSDTYKNADEKTKHSMALELLKKLESEGLIKKDSICDSNDSISYGYSVGGFGAIQLKGFDPMMN